MFVAAHGHMKSFAWADSQSGEVYNQGRLTHTLSTLDHDGPVCVFAPGCILRAGKGSVAFWNLDGLEPCPEDYTFHDDDEKDRGGPITERSEKLSAGNPPTTVIEFADPNFSPRTWAVHPNLPGNMLCAPDLFTYPPPSNRDYSCISLDLDTAKASARYLGHAGSIRLISTCKSDPNVFLTAATDGYVRWYDTRIPLPALSLHANQCTAAVFVYPDGIPLLFMSSSSEEVVKLFDVRTRKTIYELATGNNEVKGIAWDASRNVLYVSAFCGHQDRYGNTWKYRPAELGEDSPADEFGEDPLTNMFDSMAIDREGDDSMDDYDGDGSDAEHDFAWPCNAAHTEDYFGYIFDAGEHRILRYAFSDQADPTILPIYGMAHADSGCY
ncbi:hypothetical protein B0H19DRAFT_1130380 [Mycena capillaripes]|nr:hypothetical protein B0H19DRAFT_1130380 [Mycena capillaripes]